MDWFLYDKDLLHERVKFVYSALIEGLSSKSKKYVHFSVASQMIVNGCKTNEWLLAALSSDIIFFREWWNSVILSQFSD